MTTSRVAMPASHKSNKRVLLTGATGFVGSHVARRFVSEGFETTCLVRPTSDLRWLQGVDVRIQRMDMFSPKDLSKAVTGYDICVHMAGAVKARRAQQFAAVNVELTRHLVEAALGAEQGPKRFVFLSSLAAQGPSGPAAQKTGLVGRPVSAYGRSKRAAETLLAEYATNIELAILRPTAVYGPRDKAMLAAFRSARLGLAVLPAGRKQRVSFCHVEDLAQALLLAATVPLSSAIMVPVASTPDITMAEFGRILIEAVGRSTGKRRRTRLVALFPDVLKAAGTMSGILLRGLGAAPMLDGDKARELTAGDWIVDPEPAAQVLGYQPHWSLGEGLEQTARWYLQEGWL